MTLNKNFIYAYLEINISYVMLFLLNKIKNLNISLSHCKIFNIFNICMVYKIFFTLFYF